MGCAQIYGDYRMEWRTQKAKSIPSEPADLLVYAHEGEGQMLEPIRKFGMFFAALLFLAGTIAAQERYGGSVDAKEHGYQHGYRDGLRQGLAGVNQNADQRLDSEKSPRA